jgi:hypothetical protein
LWSESAISRWSWWRVEFIGMDLMGRITLHGL